MKRELTDSDYVSVPVDAILCETDRAFFVSVLGVGVWIPYSQVKDPETSFRGSGPYTLRVTRWIAGRNGILTTSSTLAMLREATRNSPPTSCPHCQHYLTGLRHTLILAEQHRLRAEHLEAENKKLRKELGHDAR